MTTKVIPIKQVGTMEIETNPMTELRNNYWMIQKLGVGGFGKVYLIKQVYLRKAVFPTYSLIFIRQNYNFDLLATI